MRVYFGMAGREAKCKIEALRGEWILETFAYPLARKYHRIYRGIFLDSGAFTAWRQGKTVDIRAYADYALEGDYDAIAGDLRIEDADPETTLRDTEYLRSQGLPAIPAFHQGEPLSYLDHMIAEYDYIGLGCTEDSSTGSSVKGWLRECFERICDGDGYPRIKVHGYRFTSLMNTFPFFSVDSTSWAQSSSNSFTSILRQFPFLTDLEAGELVIKYYRSAKRCTRLPLRQEKLELLPLPTTTSTLTKEKQL